MKTTVPSAVVRGPSASIDLLRQASGDLAGAGRIESLDFEPAEGDLSVQVTL